MLNQMLLVCIVQLCLDGTLLDFVCVLSIDETVVWCIVNLGLCGD